MPDQITYQEQTAWDPSRKMPRPPRTRSSVGFNTAAVTGGRPKGSATGSGQMGGNSTQSNVAGGPSVGMQLSTPNYASPARPYQGNDSELDPLDPNAVASLPVQFDLDALFSRSLGKGGGR